MDLAYKFRSQAITKGIHGKNPEASMLHATLFVHYYLQLRSSLYHQSVVETTEDAGCWHVHVQLAFLCSLESQA